MPWHIPLIPVLGRQRQEHGCECENGLVYILSSKPGLHSETLKKEWKKKRRRRGEERGRDRQADDLGEMY